MNIGSASSAAALQAAQASQQIGVQVLKKAQDVGQAEGEAVIQMIDDAAQTAQQAQDSATGSGKLDLLA